MALVVELVQFERLRQLLMSVRAAVALNQRARGRWARSGRQYSMMTTTTMISMSVSRAAGVASETS
jgi:hypothetical protein